MHFLRKKDIDSNSKMSTTTSNPQILALEQRISKMSRIESVDMICGYVLKYENILLINIMMLDVP